jgi:hypothetical protein
MAQRQARGFSCWGQFVAMLFCHRMTTPAQRAAQSSADSDPGPPHRAIEMPRNAKAEVIASLPRHCPGAMRRSVTARLPIVSPTLPTCLNRSPVVISTPASTTNVYGAGRRWGVRISWTLSTMIVTAAATSERPNARRGYRFGVAVPVWVILIWRLDRNLQTKKILRGR